MGIAEQTRIDRWLTDRGWTGDIYLLFSVRKRHDIVFEQELAYLQARFPNLHVAITLSDDPDASWDGARGQITREMIEGFVPALRRGGAPPEDSPSLASRGQAIGRSSSSPHEGGPVLVCGPGPMMVAMRRVLVEIGVPDAEVLEEAFLSPVATSDASPDEVIEAGEPGTIQFARSGGVAEPAGDRTVLEAAEDAGVSIPFECRSGICGQCKTKLVAGRVTMDSQDALTRDDRAKGLILACQARPVRDVIVDA